MAIGGINLAGFSGALVVGIYWIIGLLIPLFIIFLVYWYFSHKVIFIIRTVTGDRTLTYIDKARIIKKKGHPIKWRLMRKRDYVPVPPKNAIDVTTKGKLFVEAYYTSDGEYNYIVDQHDEGKQIGSLHPVTNVDKEFYAQQVEEGKKYQQKRLSEILLQIAPILAIVLILVMFLIFFDDAVQPTINLAQQLTGASEHLSRAIETMSGCVQSVTIPPN